MTVVTGIAVDHLGLAAQERAIDAAPGSPHPFQVERRYSALPAAEIAFAQPPVIPIDRRHDGHPIGILEDLAYDGRGSIWATAWIEDNVDVDELTRSSYSVEVHRRPSDTQWTIRSISITPNPGMTCLGKLLVIPDAHDGVTRITEQQILRMRRTNVFAAAMLERAAVAARDRRRGDAMTITSSYTPPEPSYSAADAGLARGLRESVWPCRATQPRVGADGVWHSTPVRGSILSVR